MSTNTYVILYIIHMLCKRNILLIFNKTKDLDEITVDSNLLMLLHSKN